MYLLGLVLPTDDGIQRLPPSWVILNGEVRDVLGMCWNIRRMRETIPGIIAFISVDALESGATVRRCNKNYRYLVGGIQYSAMGE